MEKRIVKYREEILKIMQEQPDISYTCAELQAHLCEGSRDIAEIVKRAVYSLRYYGIIVPTQTLRKSHGLPPWLRVNRSVASFVLREPDNVILPSAIKKPVPLFNNPVVYMPQPDDDAQVNQVYKYVLSQLSPQVQTIVAHPDNYLAKQVCSATGRRFLKTENPDCLDDTIPYLWVD